MSLVGPRPAFPEEVKQYSLYEKQRLSVIPGLTCYWQVSGRSNLTFQEWVELDLKYISEITANRYTINIKNNCSTFWIKRCILSFYKYPKND